VELDLCGVCLRWRDAVGADGVLLWVFNELTAVYELAAYDVAGNDPQNPKEELLALLPAMPQDELGEYERALHYAARLQGLSLIQTGDTFTEGEHLQFTGLPFFAPELFHEVEVKDPLRTKQLRTGLQQLGEEGAIQVFRPFHQGPLLLGAAGALQFEVVAHRLQHEYKAEARMGPSKFKMARWITSDTPGEVDRFITAHRNRVAYDVVDAPAVLIERPYDLKVLGDLWPNIKLHTLREHAGLVFHANMAQAQ
jgi:hypothetical protein